MNGIFAFINCTTSNLRELTDDIVTFTDRINTVQDREARGFSVGNLIMNLQGQQQKLTLEFNSYIINEDEIKIIASEFHDVKIKALYLADTYGGFNSNNIPIQLHKFYTEFNKFNSKISFGFHPHNNNEDALNKTTTAIFHGCTMIDSCIGGLGRGAGNLKSEQLITHLYRDKHRYIGKIYPLIMYFDKHILSKKDYCENKHIQSHPYYMISSTLSLHPDYIAEMLSMNTNVENDMELLMKLDKYTMDNNERNYKKSLINNL